MVTQADIARELSLSQVAVSLSLGSQSNRVSSETRRKVIETARRMGYRRHNGARTLATGRFNAAAFVQREETNFMPFELVRGVQEELGRRNMTMVFNRVPVKDVLDEHGVPHMFGEWTVDGMLLHEAQGTPRWVMDMIRRFRIPAVWLNDKADEDTVYPDELDAARRAVEMLLRLGHRRITYAHFSLRWRHADTPELRAIKRLDSHYSHHDRLLGYEQAMEQAGLTPRSVEQVFDVPPDEPYSAWSASGRRRIEIARQILEAPQRPTAIVAASDDSAGPWITAAAELGLRVPDDLSIIMIDEDNQTSSGLSISVLKQPWREVGVAGVEMLCAKVKDVDQPQPSRAIPFKEIEGVTLAQPPASVRKKSKRTSAEAGDNR